MFDPGGARLLLLSVAREGGRGRRIGKEEEKRTKKREQQRLGRKEMLRGQQPDYKWSPSKRKCCVAGWTTYAGQLQSREKSTWKDSKWEAKWCSSVSFWSWTLAHSSSLMLMWILVSGAKEKGSFPECSQGERGSKDRENGETLLLCQEVKLFILESLLDSGSVHLCNPLAQQVIIIGIIIQRASQRNQGLIHHRGDLA